MNRGICLTVRTATLLVGLVFRGAPPDAKADEDALRNRELFAVSAHAGYHTVSFSPDGKILASSAVGGQLKIWDTDSGKERMTLVGHKCEIIDVSFSPDGKWLASTGRDGARVWDAAAGTEAFVIQGKGWVSRVAFSPDGKRLAAAGAGIISLWDLKTRQEVNLLKGHAGGVTCVVFSPDSQLLASSGTDKSIRFWDPANGGELLKLTDHTGAVQTIAFSPTGKGLASASLDKTVRVWDPLTGTLVQTLLGHERGVHAVAYSPDGRLLASAGQDRKVRLWDLATGQEILTYSVERGDIHSVAISPDGQRLAATGSDGQVRVWNLEAPDRLPVALSPAELELLWEELRGDHAGNAFRAILSLSAAPDQTVPFLKRCLQPTRRADEKQKRLSQLLSDLDDRRFAVRQQATAELEQIGKLAEPALLALLEERPSLEVRQRVTRLLDRLKGSRMLPEQLLAERSVEVLERIGSPEAREILESLAGGAPGHWLTEAAKAALPRLKPPAKATRSGG